MVRYRYQATAGNDVPIFGIHEADSEASLREWLLGRGQRLQNCTVLSVDASMGAPSQGLPRLYQLRLAERVREAFLTGLPAHDAVRAMAAEPFDHPLLGIMPVLLMVSVVAVIPALCWNLLLPEQSGPLRIIALNAFVVIPACWWMMNRWLVVRPRRVLNRLADQLESGMGDVVSGTQGLPPEVQSILRSAADERGKMLAAAELIPLLMLSRFCSHRLLLTIFGSVSLAMILGLGCYWAMWQIIPQFATIFEEFEIELPFLTAVVVQSSEFALTLGLPGFLAAVAFSVGFITLLYVGLSNGKIAELISSTPIVGTPFRWLMQARVARVLAVMLHYNCDRAEALQAAMTASNFSAVRRQGEYMAASLKNGHGLGGRYEMLSGLPLSLLTIQSPGNQDDQAAESAGLAQCFHAIAGLLEQSSQGQGRFLGLLMQLMITITAGLIVGTVILSMFMPLIRLMGDLV